jgi:Photosynthesis system II assembly factor YCF48
VPLWRLTSMKLKIAAVAALGLGALVGSGIASAAVSAAPAATGSAPAAHLSLGSERQVAASACHRAQNPQPPSTGEALAAVQFVSSSTGWLVGESRVLATTNGGHTWTRQRTAAGAGYSSLDAIDNNHAWVVGRHQLIATSNGGRSWHRLPEPCPAISSVHFVSPTVGFAVDGGELLKTSDGGSLWRRVHSPARVQTMCFTNSQSGWLGAHGEIYRTTDAGHVWALVVVGPHLHSGIGRPVADVECAGPHAGWAELVGPGAAMNQQPHIGYYLNDNGSRAIFAEQEFSHPGVTVTADSPGPEFAAFSSVDASDAVFVDSCGPCGEGTAPMGIATNDGQTLHRVGRVRRINLADAASFVSTTDGWVAGEVIHSRPQGRTTFTWKLVHTSDGGAHWTTQYVA